MCHLEPVDPRHHHVEEDQVGTKLARLLERLFPIGRDGDVVARGSEVHLDEPRDIRIVVDDEDGFGHLGGRLSARDGRELAGGRRRIGRLEDPRCGDQDRGAGIDRTLRVLDLDPAIDLHGRR